ncbi:hypothetical protein A2U01_0102043, partial [Trifolium medium]|nr:hypothetical protein [Trifolium medium]
FDQVVVVTRKLFKPSMAFCSNAGKKKARG